MRVCLSTISYIYIWTDWNSSDNTYFRYINEDLITGEMSVVSFLIRLVLLLSLAYVMFAGLSYLMWIATENVKTESKEPNDADIELGGFDSEFENAFGEV